MARKRKDIPPISNVEITGVAAEGKALSRIKLKDNDENPIVVFIPYGAPGDIVDLKINKKKSNYAEGHIIQIVKPSEIRIEPKCKYFTLCGGCKWQHIPYDKQLHFKTQQVIDALSRIGKIDTPDIPLALGSDEIWDYRNKMEYTFSNRRWKSWEEMRGEAESIGCDNALGFHIPGAFDKVLHIETCHLQHDLGNSIRNFIYEYALNHNLSFYDLKLNKGFLRTLMIRIATSGEIMVCLCFGEEDKEKMNDLMNSLIERFKEITSLVYVVNTKLNDTIADQEIKIFSGLGYIEERMGDLKFRISPKSFYQTNSRQAEKLYDTVVRLADLYDEKEGFNENETNHKPLVYDLYTGTGTIANYVARKAHKVIGIEYVEEAIEDAKTNSVINNIANTEFYAGDMKDVLTKDFIDLHGKPDIMIVDPPRAGMHEDVVNVILETEPKVVVYVSCNPATQARDLSLMNHKYAVTKVQPVDMFPHTHHVENVVKLELKN